MSRCSTSFSVASPSGDFSYPPPKRKRNQKAKNEEASQTIGFERLLAVPKADTKPSKKRKTKEDKSIEIEPFAKTAFSLVFFNVYYFC